MERGAQALIKVLIAALLFGVAVLVFHPGYRGAMAALWRGTPGTSPVWQSNAAYYTEVGLPEGTHVRTE